MNFIVGGIPRGGTTIAAKFMSLHQDMFCYAGETSLLPLLFDLFGQFPCQSGNIETAVSYLRTQLMATMVEMPRFSVSRGAHPKNLIFDEDSVDLLIMEIRKILVAGYFGRTLHNEALKLLRSLLSERSSRSILGEKTPNNIFALAEYIETADLIPVAVIREPIGVIRSMRLRCDPYASRFSGGTEKNIGVYLDYSEAILRCLECKKTLLVQYEEIAEDPSSVIKRMFSLFGKVPENRVISFVEQGRDKEIADRAPVNYKRLKINPSPGELSHVDLWKVMELTRPVREAFGYNDEKMASWGFPISRDWPGEDVTLAILPLGGFHVPEPNGHIWMKGNGTLVVYMPKGALYTICLNLWSSFPSSVENDIELKILVNGLLREQIFVSKGEQATNITMDLTKDDIQPIGNKGHYVILKLNSSVMFSPIVVVPNSTDIRNISFLLYGWEIKTRCT